MKTHYIHKGTSDYYFTLCHTYQRPPDPEKMPLGVDVQKLIAEYGKNEQGEVSNINILEIGAGNGAFIWKHHLFPVCVYGISLDDDCFMSVENDAFEKFFKALESGVSLENLPTVSPIKLERHPNHYFCDIEQEIEKDSPVLKQPYDLIISQFTWIHLKEPFEALKRAYSLLKEGGILMVDMIYTKNALKFLKALNSKGYEFLSNFGPDGCSYFFIKKTQETLDISLEMDETGFNLEQFNVSTSPFSFVQVLAVKDFFGIAPEKILNKPFTAQQALKIVQTRSIETPNNSDELFNHWQPNQWGAQIDNKSNNLHIFTYVCATDRVKEFLGYLKKPSSFISKDLINTEWLYQPNEQGYLPIHIAIAYGYTELVEVFLSHDPDLLYAKTVGTLELDSFNLAHFYGVYFNQKEVFHFLKSYINKNPNFFNENNLVHSDETEKLEKEEQISNKK